MSSPETPDEAVEEPTAEDYEAVVRAMQGDGHDFGDPKAEEPDQPETFPRAYVEELRQENGRYRQRAQAGEAYAPRLHTELVRATGKLADLTDIPFDENHLDDPDALQAAVDGLLAREPHLANRRPTVDLAALLGQKAQ
jgi:hypothetical protein